MVLNQDQGNGGGHTSGSEKPINALNDWPNPVTCLPGSTRKSPGLIFNALPAANDPIGPTGYDTAINYNPAYQDGSLHIRKGWNRQ